MQITPLSTSMPGGLADAAQAGAQKKTAESCRQFEAGLWRSLLEKALASTAPKTAGQDTYQFFMVQALADKVAGQSGGFATSLQAQLAPPASSSSSPSSL